MITLPKEILQEIFLYLHQQDQIECISVCRQWKETVSEYALYRRISINSQEVLEALAKKIQEKPNIVNTIRHLLLDLDDFNAELNAVLLSLPNIITLYYLGFSPKTQSFHDEMNYPWKSNIKEIIDLSSDGSFHTILSSGECPNLTRIETEIKREQFSVLKNAPALTTLVLDKFIGTFSSLEDLHDCAPQLQSLTINFYKFTDFSRRRNIEPAVSLTTCSFTFTEEDVNINEEVLSLLKYICAKYPNLSTLEYLDDGIIGNNELTELGWLPVFAKLENKLKKLSLNAYSLSDGFFKELDQSRCQINHLNIFNNSDLTIKRMMQSQQIRYIQAFDLELSYGVIFDGFDWLKKMEMLKSLKLRSHFPNYLMNMDTILDSCPPHLKSLSFYYFELHVSMNRSSSYALETLCFFTVKLPNDMDDFISHCFPYLSTVEMKYCEMTVTTWNLDKMDLDKFTFADYFYSDKQTICIICNSETKWYTYREAGFRGLHLMQNNFIFQHEIDMLCKYGTENASNASPRFTLNCNSLKSFVFKV